MKRKILLAAFACMPLIYTEAQNLPCHGYRGHLDTGYSIGIGDYDFGRFEVNTAHGYLFNPYLFVGAGAGIHFMSSYASGESI